MPSGQGGVAGISGGGGLAGFFTNANCVDQLAGPFWTATFNIGIGPAKFSISYATDGTIRIASFGPPFAGGTLGASGSLFQTTTVV